MRSRPRSCRGPEVGYRAAIFCRTQRRLQASCPGSSTAIYGSGAASDRERSASLGGYRADHPRHLHDAFGGESALGRVLLACVLVRGIVYAVDLVAGNVALDPLHVFPLAIHAADDAA